MSRFFSIEPKEEEDDQKTKELDRKVEDLLKEIATASATVPQDFLNLMNTLAQDKEHPLDPEKTRTFLTNIYRELPDIASIMGNWTSTLTAYANYRALKRAERINEQLLRSNRVLSYATVLLAIATFFLVLVSVLRG